MNHQAKQLRAATGPTSGGHTDETSDAARLRRSLQLIENLGTVRNKARSALFDVEAVLDPIIRTGLQFKPSDPSIFHALKVLLAPVAVQLDEMEELPRAARRDGLYAAKDTGSSLSDSTGDEQQKENTVAPPFARAMELIGELEDQRNHAICALFNLGAILYRLGEQSDTNGDSDAQIFHALSTLALDIECRLQEHEEMARDGRVEIKALLDAQ